MRVRAALGIEQPGPTISPEQQQIRGAFLQMFPELKGLVENPEHLNQVLEMARTGRLQETSRTGDAFWHRHAQQTARTATTKFAAAAGVTADKLPKGFEARMAQNLMQFIQADRTGERYQRFEQGDEALVDELVADMQETYLNPFRVAQNNDAANLVNQNRNLPRRGPTGNVPANGGQGPVKRTREETRKAAREFVRTNMGG